MRLSPEKVWEKIKLQPRSTSRITASTIVVNAGGVCFQMRRCSSATTSAPRVDAFEIGRRLEFGGEDDVELAPLAHPLPGGLMVKRVALVDTIAHRDLVRDVIVNEHAPRRVVGLAAGFKDGVLVRSDAV